MVDSARRLPRFFASLAARERFLELLAWQERRELSAGEAAELERYWRLDERYERASESAQRRRGAAGMCPGSALTYR